MTFTIKKDPSEKLSERVMVQLTESTFKRLDEIRGYRPRADFIREALEEKLERET